MGFLAPWYFALVAAAAVPLLLHLLRRRIGTRVDFPAVRYLLRAEQEQSARLRLRNWLLMLLRVLAVLLIALAAARPVARAGGGGHVPSAIAIVLDNSLSTSAVVGGRPVLDGLRAAARDVAAAASADDRLWLVTADGQVVGGGRQVVVDAVERVGAIAGAGDLSRAVARAAETVRAAGRSAATVVVLTDGQASSWRAGVDAHGVRVVVHAPAGAAPRNRAVLAAASRPARWTPGGTVVARVLSVDSTAYRVSELDAAGGRTLSRGTVGPDGEVRVRVQPATAGWLAGTVAVEPDELRGDDQRYFAAFSGPPPGAVADPSAGPFAASALATLTQSGRLSTGGTRPARIASADVAGALPALLAAPTDPARLGPANQALERLGVPWRFAALRSGETPVRMMDSASAGAIVTRRYQLVPRGTARADTLATAGGEPWIVAGPGYVLVASPLVPEATTLPVRAAFVPWLGAVVAERLAGEAGRVDAAIPGASVEPPPGIDGMIGAEGRRVPVGAGAISAPDRPGVYFWMQGGARAGALVVNVEPDESQLARLSARDVGRRIGAGTVRVPASSDDVVAEAYGAEGQRPIAAAVLAAALLALLAEGIVTRRATGTATARAA